MITNDICNKCRDLRLQIGPYGFDGNNYYDYEYKFYHFLESRSERTTFSSYEEVSAKVHELLGEECPKLVDLITMYGMRDLVPDESYRKLYEYINEDIVMFRDTISFYEGDYGYIADRINEYFFEEYTSSYRDVRGVYWLSEIFYVYEWDDDENRICPVCCFRCGSNYICVNHSPPKLELMGELC